MNHFLEHYIKNKISPVKQDISNLQKHFHRRTSLYKVLGATNLTFNNSKVLEVGPGGGYNPLVTQSYGLKQYDLVEPNQYAIKDIKNIFEQYEVDQKNITIHNCMLEDFKKKEEYDIVICEGMIPGLENKYEVLEKLNTYLKENSIFILTCIDEVAFFFEILRYYIAQQLINDNLTFEEKLDIFEEAFTPHLNTLEGMSRFKRDWCADSLFGLMHFNYNLSFKEAVEFHKNNLTYYNSSPNLFNDFRWYKQIPDNKEEYNDYFIDQFNRQRHNLLHYKIIYSQRDVEKNYELTKLCKKIFNYIKESTIDKKEVTREITTCLENILINLEDITENKDELYLAINEIKQIIETKDFNIDAIKNRYPNFRKAFGNGAFYISLIKE